MKILVLDVGGTNLKALATGHRKRRKVPSGPRMTARQMVAAAKELCSDWDYDVVSIGYPGPVLRGRPLAEPRNLGKGWVGFDFEKAFGRPVRLVNDAAMQALGSYQGGRMLFLGLGTGLGSALVDGDCLEPMEIAHLPYQRGRTFEDYVGQRGLERLGARRWRKAVADVVDRLASALEADYVVLGGGNAKLVGRLPKRARLGDNANAFRGGFLLWKDAKPRKRPARRRRSPPRRRASARARRGRRR